MYSYEERMRAINLYIKYDLSAAATIRELGYPNRSQLRIWYKEYLATGDLHKKCQSSSIYTDAQKQKAVDYYWEHGRNVRRTVKTLGYPSRQWLTIWIKQRSPESEQYLIRSHTMVNFTEEQRKQAVVELCSRDTSANVVAKRLGTTRANLYNWKRQLLSKECVPDMREEKEPGEIEEVARLKDEVNRLQDQIDHQKMELEVLQKAAELIKKEEGFNLIRMSNREKTLIVEALRQTYPLEALFLLLNLPKSSYYYQRGCLERSDKYSVLRQTVTEIFHENYDCYGYRRIYECLKHSGVRVSEKVVRRLMREADLVASQKRRRQYRSYQGEISPAVDNIIDRNFHADAPNELWLTDLTEFQIPAGKIYLSPIIDCYDGLAVSWSIGTSPNAELVNTMLDAALYHLDDDDHPIVHSDRGAHYRWPGWIARMDQAKLTRSMSKKGCSPDNAACESFFGHLKNECFYRRDFKNYSVDQFIRYLDDYIIWYNSKRIKKSLGYLSPLAYRQQRGCAV